MSLGWLEGMSYGHRHAAHLVSAAFTGDTLRFSAEPSFALPRRGAVAPAHAATAGFALALVRLGVEHILTGYDHLVFLLGLVVVARRARPLLGVVTAFTLAHSLTFALAASGMFSPPAYYVELAIALSIAYVGLENLLGPSERGRWRLTFLFGLIHGFGFASALSEVELPPVRLPLALLLFNLGVELGQLCVLAPLLPLVLLLRRQPAFAQRIVPALSALVLAAGMLWFAARV